MEDFREFIELMGVVDIPCVGGKYSWLKNNGKVMRIIDSFLVSNKLIEVWGVLDQRIGSRDISEHAPIRLNSGFVNWGLKTFRFNNVWFKHEEFMDFISVEWEKLNIEGRGDFILFEKLKCLKERLRTWNQEVFGWIDLKVSEEAKKINILDKMLMDN